MSRAVNSVVGRAVLVGGLVLAGASLGAPAQAAAKPPAASQLKVVQRADHQLAVQFAVPTAFYHPGAGSVVRLTGGRTPAASPSKGYAVPTDGRHVSRTAATLLASQDYTFAVWIRDHGVYSKRTAITTRTLADTTRPNPVTGLTAKASIGDGSGQVKLTWTGDHTDRIGYVRIVRNTRPTTTGGDVVAAQLPAGTETWTDTRVGALARDDYSTPTDPATGWTQQRFYYFVIERDRAGNFSRSYANASDVFGTRMLSGTVTGGAASDSTNIVAFAGTSPRLKSAATTIASSGGGAFAMRVPPGLYTVCDTVASNPAANRCWVVRSDGTAGTAPGAEIDDPLGYPNAPAPSIDVTQGDYTAIRFAANAG